MKDQLLAPHCHHCGKLSTPEKKLRVCAGCLCVYYCDRGCKNHVGERHDKVECKKYAGSGMKEMIETCKHDVTWRVGSIDERLWHASNIGRIGAVRALIAEGGDFNWVSADGFTALHMSALNGHFEVLKLLIASGTRMDTVSTDERMTALHLAAIDGYLLIVLALVEASADIHIKTKKGMTSLDCARVEGFPDIVEFLTIKAEEQRTGRVKEDDIYEGWPRHMKHHVLAPHCHTCGKLYTAKKKLYRCGRCRGVYYCDESCRKQDCERHTKGGEGGECKQLLKNDMKEMIETCKHDVTWRVGSIDNRLCQASYIGRIGAVRALIAEGGDVNRVGAHGWTLLHTSAMYGHLEVVKLLIASGTRFDTVSTDEMGWTALQMAAFSGYLLIVLALVEAGADIHIKDKSGYTALDNARAKDFPDIVELLTNKAEEQRAVAARAEAKAEAIRAQALAELLADDDREKAAGGSKANGKSKSKGKDKGKGSK